MKFRSLKIAVFTVTLFASQISSGLACTDYENALQQEGIVDSASALHDLIVIIRGYQDALTVVINKDSVPNENGQDEIEWSKVKSLVSKIESKLKEIKNIPLAKAYFANLSAAQKHTYSPHTKFPAMNIDCSTCRGPDYHGCDCRECGPGYGRDNSWCYDFYLKDCWCCVGDTIAFVSTFVGCGYNCFLYQWILGPFCPGEWDCEQVSCARVTCSEGGTHVNSTALRQFTFQINRALDSLDRHLSGQALIPTAVPVEEQQQMVR